MSLPTILARSAWTNTAALPRPRPMILSPRTAAPRARAVKTTPPRIVARPPLDLRVARRRRKTRSRNTEPRARQPVPPAGRARSSLVTVRKGASAVPRARSLPRSDAQREQAADAVGDADSAAAASRTTSTVRLATADDHDGSRGSRALDAAPRASGGAAVAAWPRDGPRPDDGPRGRPGAAHGRRQLGKRLRFRELRQREAGIRDGDRGQRRRRGGLVGAGRSTGGEGGEEAERAHEHGGRRARRHTSDRAGPLDQGRRP